jgi:pyruvate dehydrogenase E2 component (dihydrolipoamide acetyltransferase)
MGKAFKLPDLGEGIHEGEIVAVRVNIGDTVKEGDIILEVETDKALVEIPSPFRGVVTEIRVKPGDVVKVGDTLIAFDGNGTAAAAVSSSATARPAAAGTGEKGAPVAASPATRRLARELGVDLAQVPPTGDADRVTSEDVKAFAARRQSPPAAEGAAIAPRPAAPPAEAPERPLPAAAVPALPDFSRWGAVRRVPVRSVRRATARQMALAWSQIPHVNCQDSIDITELARFRENHKAKVARLGGKLTLTVFALKAAATALKRYPHFNASLDTAAGEIVLKDYFHIGVAVETPDGLIVPVIKDVDRKSITELAVELTDLAARTRERKAKLEEMQGGTFTITNAGALGGGFFSPIINYPEVAILGMGSAQWQPVVQTDTAGKHCIVSRLILPVVLCIDHRVLDGADAVRFLIAVKEALQDPQELLMTMI